MQRDPLQGENQLWDWQYALQDGVTYLNTVLGNAQTYLNTWYNDAAQTSDPSDDWSWDPHNQYPDRVWDEGFSRYNTGSGIYKVNGNGGVENCSLNSQGCLYRDQVRGILAAPPY